MRTKRLGSTDLELTVIGIGTWAIGGGEWQFGWGPQNEKDSFAAIVEGLELGLNWIDTAAAYGFGISERVVGKAVHDFGGNVIIATKCGILQADGGNIRRYISRETVRQEAEDSLRRLNVDYIDLYQIHWPVPDEKIEEAFETLLELKEEGKIRWPGVSNFSTEQLDRCSRLGPVASLQPSYSLLDRRIEEEVLPWCRAHEAGVVAYSPMASGLLTGKVTDQWVRSLPESDWRKKNREHHLMRLLWEPLRSKLQAFVNELEIIARKSGHTAAQLAVAWVLANPDVTCAIAGTRKKGQLRDVAGAAEWKLGAVELNAVEQAYDEYLAGV